jgi:glycerol-3-phosphate dehydrogenase
VIANKRQKVVIIGGGLLGTAAARELSRLDLDITLIEKEPEVSFGVSKASSSIVHPGFRYWKPEQLRSSIVKEGHTLLRSISEEISAPYEEVGELIVARNEDEMEILSKLKKQGETNGLTSLEIIDKKRLMEMEPYLTDEAIAALWAPTAAISSSFEFTIALAESAEKNGVNIKLETEVTGIKKDNKGYIVLTNNGDFHADYVINAAGLGVSKVAAMAGDRLPIKGQRGQEYIMDKNSGYLVKHMVFPAKGPFVIPTVHGNLMIGTTKEELEDYDDTSTTGEAFAKIFSSVKKLVPELNRGQLIQEFAGVRPNPESGDVEITDKVPGFISICSGSPGVQASVAMAKRITERLAKENPELKARDDFDPYRDRIPCFSDMSIEEKREIIKKDSRYSHVICRCETVTEGEIVEAIKRGARTIDGVKYRVRAGMGRCHGGFCGPRVAGILARELKVPMEKIKKNKSGSYYVMLKTKELLLQSGGDARC